MKELLTWLVRIRDVQRSRPDLFDALLTGRYGAYVRYRLRFVFPRLLVRLLSHAFEVFVLAQALPWEWFAPLISYRASSTLLGGTYWGFLEQLRTHVRTEVRARRYDSARCVIEGWLGLSLIVAAASVAGIFVQTSIDAAGGGLNLIHAYGWACYVRLAFDVVARTYHSGIFAMQRVYRPLATIVIPDLTELLVTLFAFRFIGPWGIPLSIVLAGSMRSLWTIHYARRAYGHARVRPPSLRALPRSLRRLSGGDLRSGLVHALANGTAQVDSLLILALTQAPGGDPAQPPLAVIYYVLRPLMATGHGWTRVFYFDWKRLEAGTGRVFQPFMRAMLLRVALSIVALIGSLLLALSAAVFGSRGLTVVAMLVALLMVRAAFSLEQLEAFSLGHYRRLAVMASVFAGVLASFAWLRVSEVQVLVGAIASLVGALLWSRRLRLQSPDSTVAERSLPAWVAMVRAHMQPAVVITMCVDRSVAPPSRVRRALESRFPSVRFVDAARTHMAGFVSVNEAPTRAQLVGAAGGALRELDLVASTTGREAIQKLIEGGWLKRTLGIELGAPAAGREALIHSFRRSVPTGHVLELDEGRGRAAKEPMTWMARRAVLREIAIRSMGRRPRSTHASPFRVAVFAPGGVPKVAFVAPRGAQGFAAFLRETEAASLSASLYGSGGSPAANAEMASA